MNFTIENTGNLKITLPEKTDWRVASFDEHSMELYAFINGVEFNMIVSLDGWTASNKKIIFKVTKTDPDFVPSKKELKKIYDDIFNNRGED